MSCIMICKCITMVLFASSSSYSSPSRSPSSSSTFFSYSSSSSSSTSFSSSSSSTSFSSFSASSSSSSSSPFHSCQPVLCPQYGTSTEPHAKYHHTTSPINRCNRILHSQILKVFLAAFLCPFWNVTLKRRINLRICGAIFA